MIPIDLRYLSSWLSLFDDILDCWIHPAQHGHASLHTYYYYYPFVQKYLCKDWLLENETNFINFFLFDNMFYIQADFLRDFISIYFKVKIKKEDLDALQQEEEDCEQEPTHKVHLYKVMQ